MKKVVKNDVLKSNLATAKSNPLLRFQQIRRELKNQKISLPQETIFSIVTIERFAGQVNVPYSTLYKDFKTILNAKRGKVVAGTNDEGRFYRCLYRNVEQVEGKKSKQSKDFNIKSNIKSIKIKTKTPILYKENSKGIQTDADLTSVKNNFYSFVVTGLTAYTEKEKAYNLKRKITAILKAEEDATKPTPKETPKKRKAKVTK